MNPGTKVLAFNAINLTSGIYIYRLIGNNINISKKMILMKINSIKNSALWTKFRGAELI